MKFSLIFPQITNHSKLINSIRNRNKKSSILANRIALVRLFTTTPQICLNQKWRKERGLPMNPNASGILTDGADFTYLDGRLTPYNTGQQIRIKQQREIAEKIIRLTGEIDFAVNRHKQMQIDEENRKKDIIDRKLKPKGANLLKSQ